MKKVELTPALLGVLLRHTCPSCGGAMPAGEDRCDQCRALLAASATEESVELGAPS